MASDALEPDPEMFVLVVDDSPIDRELVGGLLRRRANLRVAYAEHGLAALESMERELPDLVLTDLHMPELDGLGLVETVRRQFPLIPTILMTAHGSEEIAIAALQRGAASYVPKRDLARRLVATVREILDLSGEQRQQRRLFDCWNQTQFQFTLDNDSGRIPPLIAHIHNHLATAAVCEANEAVRVGVALHEAVQNAIHHGNLELNSELRSADSDTYYLEAERRRRQPPYRDRQVKILVRETPHEGEYVVRDEGPGFDPRNLHDPTLADNLDKPHGRGMFLIRTFMDEVSFNSSGNEIRMLHRRRKFAARVNGCSDHQQTAIPNSTTTS